MTVVALSDKFWADHRVIGASKYHRSSVGVFLHGLNFLAGVSADVEEPCIPAFFLKGVVAEKQPRRVMNALVKNDLWEPLPRSRRGDIFQPLAEGDLWRIIRGREPIPDDVRAAVVTRDGRACQLCGGAIYEDEVFHLDHIQPWSQGGRTTVDNLQVAHARCNLAKGARV